MTEDAGLEQPPRNIGTTVSTFSFPNSGYSNKYQNWFFNAHQDQITGTVLDIGAEENQMGRYGLSDSDDTEYICMDMRTSPSLDIVGDGCNLPFQNESFDTVILREVLEHVQVLNIPALIDEVYRVLSHEGRLLATSPFRFQIHGYEYTDKLRLTADGLHELLQCSGFENVNVYKAGGFAESVCSPLQTAWFMAVSHAGMESLRFGFAVVHYPAVVLWAVFAAIEMSICGEGVLDKTFYLHNLTTALKRTHS